MIARLALVCGALIVSTVRASAEMPWHAEGWSHRAVVAISAKGDQGADVAAVRIYHGSIPLPNGDDYRVFDQAGRPVPYQITYHHLARDTLISFRCRSPDERFAIYYGNKDAPPDRMRAVLDPTPGAGPPKAGPDSDGWIPRAGLVLTTMRRPRKADNPRNIEQLRDLIRQSPALDGAAYRRNISDGFNPFGNSDYFISAYRGWIRLPTSGRYGFCTASNEASFSFMDARNLVHWPGRHTEQRGKFGQKNAVLNLSAGLHYVEYYHEEVLLYQVAFLGYKPPWARYYTGIGDALFPQPHRAQVLRYETAGPKRSVALRPELIDSVWPKHHSRSQHTRYRFVADPGSQPAQLADWKLKWDFGDGQSARGAQVEHVYMSTGNYRVTFTASPPGGPPVKQTWALTVFPVEHLGGPYKSADPESYKAIVDRYDRTKLGSFDLAALARFYDDLGAQQAAIDVARVILGRSDAATVDLADAHVIIAQTAEFPSRHLAEALKQETNPVKRLGITATLINVLGVRKGDMPAVDELYEQAKQSVAGKAMEGKLKAAFREVTAALGDAHLHARQREQALEAYHLAEALADPPIPFQVRSAKIGAYHELIVRHLEARRFDAAMAVTRQWRRELPSEQVRGEVLYWLGKISFLRGEAQEAISPLTLAIELGEGNEYEAEARYLLAQAYLASGDAEAHRDTLRGLVNTGLAGLFRDKALEDLAE